MLRGAACPCPRQDRCGSGSPSTLGAAPPFLHDFAACFGAAPPCLRLTGFVLAQSRDFCFTIPGGAFPTQPPTGSSGSHPSGKDISNRCEPFPPGLEFEIISVRVLSEFYIVNTLPDLAPLSDAGFPGLPGMGSACRTPGRCAGAAGVGWGSFSPRPAGKDRREQSRRQGTIPHGRGEPGWEIPPCSLLTFCFPPFQPRHSSDRVSFPLWGAQHTEDFFPFLLFSFFLLKKKKILPDAEEAEILWLSRVFIGEIYISIYLGYKAALGKGE